MPMSNTAQHLRFLKQRVGSLKDGTPPMGFCLIMKGTRDGVLHIDKREAVLGKFKTPLSAHQALLNTRAFKLARTDPFWSEPGKLVTITGTVQNSGGTLQFTKTTGKGKEADFKNGMKAFKLVLKKECVFVDGAPARTDDAIQADATALASAFQAKTSGRSYISPSEWGRRIYDIFDSVDQLSETIDAFREMAKTNADAMSTLQKLEDAYNSINDWGGPGGVAGVEGAMAAVVDGIDIIALQAGSAAHEDAARQDLDDRGASGADFTDMEAHFDQLDDLIEGIAEPDDFDNLTTMAELDALDELLDMVAVGESMELETARQAETQEIIDNIQQAREDTHDNLEAKKKKGFKALVVRMKDWKDSTHRNITNRGHFWFTSATSPETGGFPLLLAHSTRDIPHAEDAERIATGPISRGWFAKNKAHDTIAFQIQTGPVTETELNNALADLGVHWSAVIVDSIRDHGYGDQLSAIGGKIKAGATNLGRGAMNAGRTVGEKMGADVVYSEYDEVPVLPTRGAKDHITHKKSRVRGERLLERMFDGVSPDDAWQRVKGNDTLSELFYLFCETRYGIENLQFYYIGTQQVAHWLKSKLGRGYTDSRDVFEDYIKPADDDTAMSFGRTDEMSSGAAREINIPYGRRQEYVTMFADPNATVPFSAFQADAESMLQLVQGENFTAFTDSAILRKALERDPELALVVNPDADLDVGEGLESEVL